MYSSPVSVYLSYYMLAVIMVAAGWRSYWTGVPKDNMLWWQIKRRIIEGNP